MAFLPTQTTGGSLITKVLTVVCVLFTVHFQSVSTSSLIAEAASQNVAVKIYDMKVDDWNATAFKDLVREYTNYCNSHLSTCGLISAATFTSSDVVTTSPSKEDSSIVFSVHITYPSGASVNPNSSTQYVVPSDATSEIIFNTRDAYHVQTGRWMTYIGGEYYSVPPDAKANEVVISLAFLVVFLTGITAAVLKHHEERTEKDNKLKRRMKEKKKNHVMPNYNILETTNTTILSNNTPRYSDTMSHAKVVPEGHINYSTWNVDKKPSNTKTLTSPSYTAPSVNEFYEVPSIKKNGLKPLEREELVEAKVEETDADKKEKKRKKKEKRREKRRLQELEMNENRGFDSSNVSDNENNTSTSTRPIHTISVERDSIA